MLDKTEEAFKNGQSRDTDNIGYTGHGTQTNKATNFRIKMMFGSSLPPVVCNRVHVLSTLFV